MAIWQYKLLLIPQQTLAKIHPTPPPRLDTHDLEEFDWWKGVSLPPGHSQVLGRLIPPGKSWDADIQIWGELDGNRVELSFEDGQIVAITARIDLRNLDLNFVDGLVAFAEYCGCFFVGEDLVPFDPSSFELLHKIENCDGIKFLEDPTAFLASLQRRKKD